MFFALVPLLILETWNSNGDALYPFKHILNIISSYFYLKIKINAPTFFSPFHDGSCVMFWVHSSGLDKIFCFLQPSGLKFIASCKKCVQIAHKQYGRIRGKSSGIAYFIFLPFLFLPLEPLPCKLSIPLHSLLSWARVSLSHNDSAVY